MQAEVAGLKIDSVVADEGVSGVSTILAERPQGRRIHDLLRAGDVLVVPRVDRLGRNYADVTETIREFMRRGVIVRTVINAMVFDGVTTDPVQMAVCDALIGFMAATAQAQAKAKAAQKAGTEHARTQADHTAYLGRKPSYSRAQFESVVAGLDRGENVSAIAEATGLTRERAISARTAGVVCAWGWMASIAYRAGAAVENLARSASVAAWRSTVPHRGIKPF
jgi:DNA invertase Pin-like site-specific DNA recombinase